MKELKYLNRAPPNVDYLRTDSAPSKKKFRGKQTKRPDYFHQVFKSSQSEERSKASNDSNNRF